jgi:hypothetical protein
MICVILSSSAGDGAVRARIYTAKKSDSTGSKRERVKNFLDIGAFEEGLGARSVDASRAARRMRRGPELRADPMGRPPLPPGKPGGAKPGSQAGIALMRAESRESRRAAVLR